MFKWKNNYKWIFSELGADDKVGVNDAGIGIFKRQPYKGLAKEILQNDLEHCMRIPMTDNVRALNVSNSVAIVIYEALRQQDYNDLLMEEPHKGNDFLERD